MSKRKIFYKSAEEAEIIRANGVILGKAHAEVAKLVEPGITTLELDRVAEQFIRDNGGKPSFKNLYGFPSSLCISVNENVVHGFPNKKELKEGDIVSVDCGVDKNGFHADSAYTYAVGEISEKVEKLLSITKQSLMIGIEKAVVGNRVGDVSYAIQKYNEAQGYGVVRELVGHGIGRSLHEAPEVPNFGKRGNGAVLRQGTTIAIEPMVTMGKRFVVQEEDGWTIRTEDRSPSAHFEHTVFVDVSGPQILTTFKYIEEVLKNKNAVLV